MKISILIGAVLLLSNLYIWVNARSLKSVNDHNKDVNNEDKDSSSPTKFGSQMSFIEEFLAFASPNEDGERKESIQKKVIEKESTTITKEEKFEDKVNERHDKIYWSDDELYQLKLSEKYSSKASLSNRNQEGRETREGNMLGIPLTPASDRQLVVTEPEFSREWIEERYTQLIQVLPGKIEEAVAVIRETIATQRMLGYTFVVSFVMAAILDSLALILIAPRSLTEAITLILTDKASHGFLHWVWWYAFGFSGMFPHVIFLLCLSRFLFFFGFLSFAEEN